MTWSRLTMGLATALLLAACDGGSTISPTAREICEASVRCAPSTSLDECVDTVQAQLDTAVRVGCIAEANAGNACTLGALGTPDGGACSFDPADCDAEYRAYNECLAENGGTNDVSCAVDSSSFTWCVTYLGLSNDPETTCDSLMGTVVAECPTTDAVGTCESEVSGVTVITTYYGPLSTGVTPELFANQCRDMGGTWSMP